MPFSCFLHFAIFCLLLVSVFFSLELQIRFWVTYLPIFWKVKMLLLLICCIHIWWILVFFSLELFSMTCSVLRLCWANIGKIGFLKRVNLDLSLTWLHLFLQPPSLVNYDVVNHFQLFQQEPECRSYVKLVWKPQAIKNSNHQIWFGNWGMRSSPFLLITRRYVSCFRLVGLNFRQ